MIDKVNCYLCNKEAYTTDICEYHANNKQLLWFIKLTCSINKLLQELDYYPFKCACEIEDKECTCRAGNIKKLRNTIRKLL